MKYPKEVLTKNKEVRGLMDKGSYTRYTYIDPPTGKPIKDGKYSLILKSESSTRHLFVIPTKSGKQMIVKDEIDNTQRKVWNKDRSVDV